MPPGGVVGRRRQRDWSALHTEWLQSGKPYVLFLQEKGLNPWAGNVRERTKEWFKSVPSGDPGAQTLAKQNYTSVLEAIKEEAFSDHPMTVPEMWQMYLQWRQRQCQSDYTTAEDIRKHLRLLLQNGTVPMGTDAAGNTIMGTTFSPSDLARIAQVAESVQKIQRLSLGMSTENVGMDRPEDTSHIEKTAQPASTDPQLPTYVVEMSRGGKFVRSRPRLVSQALEAQPVPFAEAVNE